MSYAGADYHLIGGSPWRGAGADGLDLGALFYGGSATASRTPQPIEGDGTISDGPVGGSSCPALTFMVGSYVVRVDAATQFVGGSCGTLRLGSRIHGRGIVNSDGTVSLSLLVLLD